MTGRAATRAALERYREVPWLPELSVMVAIVAVLPFLRPTLPPSIYVSGIVNAAAVILLALPLILAWRTNRFLHLGALGFAILASRVYAGLHLGTAPIRAVDSLCACLQPTEAWIRVNWVVALAIAVAVGVGLPWVFHQTVVRRFQQSPPITATVASLFAGGVALAFDRAVLDPWFFTPDQNAAGLSITEPSPPPFSLDFSIGATRFSEVDIALVACAIAVVGGTLLHLRRSAAGRAVRAAASDAARASTLGIDVFGVTRRMWVVGGLSATLFAVTSAWSFGTPDVSGARGLPVEVFVPALLAAILAKLTSIGVACAAALAIGLLERGLLFTTGTPRALDLGMVVIVAVVLLLRRDESTRAEREGVGGPIARELRPIPPELRRLPVVQGWVRGLGLAVAVVLLAAPWVLSTAQTRSASATAAGALVALSVLVVSGWSGQLSFGQAGFALVGAWTYAVSGLPAPLALVAGGAAGGVVAAVVGLPALRLRGLDLAVMTLAFAVSVSTLLTPEQYLGARWPELVERPVLLGMSFEDVRVRYYGLLVLVAAVTLSAVGLRRTRTARALLAARDNEALTSAYGISVTRARLLGFATSGAIAGIGGSLLVLEIGSAGDLANASRNVAAFSVAVVGGLGAIAGPLLGATWEYLVGLLGFVPLVRQFGISVGFMAILVLSTGGLVELLADVRDGMLRRVAARHRIVVPTLLEESRWVYGRAPMLPKTRSRRGGEAFVPTRYEPAGQWALAGHGVEEPVG